MCDVCLCVMYALCDVCLCVMCACLCDVCVAVCNIIEVTKTDSGSKIGVELTWNLWIRINLLIRYILMVRHECCVSAIFGVSKISQPPFFHLQE